jgi:hypothetical protein
MSVPNFLSKTNNSDCPVTFLSKGSVDGSVPSFLSKGSKVASQLVIEADLVMAQMLWYKPADLDLHLFYRQNGSNVHCYYGSKSTNLAVLNEDSGVSGAAEYDFNPYTNRKEQCYSEMLFASTPAEFEMWVKYFSVKDRSCPSFASIAPMARIAFLKKVSDGKQGLFGTSAAKYRTVEFVDVVFDQNDKDLQDPSKKWFSCFNIKTQNPGQTNQSYLVTATGNLTSNEPSPNLANTPGTDRAKFPSFG